MKQTNCNFIFLLRNHTNQKLFNEAEYDGEYDPSLNKKKLLTLIKIIINIKVVIILLKHIMENNQIL